MRAFGVATLLVAAVSALSAQQPAPPAPSAQTPPVSPAAPSPNPDPQSGPQPGPQKDAREAVSPAQLAAAIDKLGTLDFTERMTAARTARRADASLAVPALLKAVESHPDGFVRFRALVLLSGFNDPRTRDIMRGALGLQNDRLRAVAYTYFEHNADPAVVPKLLAAVPVESSEFVRPALTRALASYAADPKVRETMAGLVMKGQAFFRSAVIEALGDYRATYAVAPITEVAKIDGPMQVDAAIALGKIGDKASLPTLARLQQSAPRESQPGIAAAICLLGVNCESHEPYLANTLRFAIANIGYQELVRGSAAGLASLAVSGREPAAAELIRQGAPTRDPARASIVLNLGTIALRNTPSMLKVLQGEGMLEPGSDLLREAFDMLEEDFEEERFFVSVRRAYWQAAAGSPARTVCETLIRKLEF
jgi:HEAT repeat protein